MTSLTLDQTTRLHSLSQDINVQQLRAIYARHGAEIRFVGGCVRDVMMGLPVGDRDLATTARPDQGMAWLQDAGIVVKPTGIKHGTITAIIDAQPFEITTLRRDVKTDGRHAEVVFGTSWDDDAKRRDFTVNGLSCDMDGQLYDTVGGLADLQTGRIRFIGDATKRITEDYLRILRLFRFWARFGQQPIDNATLNAVNEQTDGLQYLSAQRVWTELRKVLAVPRAGEAFRLMQDYGVLPSLFDGQYYKTEQLSAFCMVEDAIALAPENDPTTALRRLAALFAYRTQQGWTIDWSMLRDRLQLSNREADHLRALDRVGQAGVWWTGHLLAALAEFGRTVVIDICLLSVALGHETQADLEATLPDLLSVAIPVFPVTSGDLMALGHQPGPQIGQLMAKIRNYWLDTNCQASRDDCLALIRD